MNIFKRKIRFAHNKNNNELFEINIPEYQKVETIKVYILEILEKKQCQESLDNVNFICRNIILNKYNLIEFYRISPEDEIWAGQMKYFLTDDDVIVELVLIRWVPHLMRVVKKKSDPISRITSIIERMFGETGRIDMWNAHDGNRLEETAIIGEMDWGGGYKKIIISWGQGMGRIFKQCRVMHDRHLIERVWEYDWKIHFEVFRDILDGFKKWIAHLDENFWQCLLADPRLVEALLRFKKFNRHSFKIVVQCCCVAGNLYDIFKDHLRRECENTKLKIIGSMSTRGFSRFFRIILVAFMLENIDNFQSINSNKSMRDIVSAASCWEAGQGQKRFFDYVLFFGHCDYLIEDNIWKPRIICVYMQNSIIGLFQIPRNVKTILEAKKAISWKTGIPLNDLFTIRAGANEQPKDEDFLEDEFYEFEVICSYDRVKKRTQIGQGGYADVFLSEDDVTKKIIALKTSNKYLDKYIYRESIILSQFHRCSSFSFFRGLYRNADNTICIAMKYFPGGSLQSYLKDLKGLLEEEIARISRNLLQQLDKIHSRNIIHGDIKTDNVVFDENREPHLIDFGLSKDCKESQSKMLVKYSGNDEYQAPEIQREKPYATKMDIWSLGVMVIEMRTGKKPVIKVQHEAVQARDSAIVQYEAGNISDELKEFIDLSTKPDQSERANAKELLESQFIKKYQN